MWNLLGRVSVQKKKYWAQLLLRGLHCCTVLFQGLEFLKKCVVLVQGVPTPTARPPQELPASFSLLPVPPGHWHPLECTEGAGAVSQGLQKQEAKGEREYTEQGERMQTNATV